MIIPWTASNRLYVFSTSFTGQNINFLCVCLIRINTVHIDIYYELQVLF